MMNEFLRVLLSLTLASSVGIVAVLLIRRPARYIFGSSACYSLWLLVPVAMVAALLPHAGSPVSMTWSIDSVSALTHALPPSLAIGSSLSPAPSIEWQTLAFGAWCLGAVLFIAYLTLQQRAFVKSLGRLSGSRGVLRAARPEGCPVLLGVLRPKIVLPADFDSRYTRLERLLIFSHERTHLRRGDAGCNGLVALLRCLFWFNPLVHLASTHFRVDQEFACDAAVMRDYPASRRMYAAAMLKTQLSDLVLPVGCHWRSVQGLKERVRMLKRGMPSRRRRACGITLTVSLSLVVGCATWVGQPPQNGPQSASAVTPAQSPIAGSGPVDVTADAANVVPGPGGPVLELHGNGQVVAGPKARVQFIADNGYRNGVSQVPTNGAILQGHVRITIAAPTDIQHWQIMVLETDRAILLARQPNENRVIRFEEGTVHTQPETGILTAPLSLTAPETLHLVTPNFKDADLAQVARAVGLMTNRTFIIDPRVHERVTMVSSSPMTPDAFYQAFLGILQAHRLAALPAVDSNTAVLPRRPIALAGDAIWITPMASAR